MNPSQVSFLTAFAYYEQGATIQSISTGREFANTDEALRPVEATFESDEVRGKWVVCERQANDTHMPGYEGIKVTGARVVIDMDQDEENVTASGLIIVGDSGKEPKFEGTIVVAGPGTRLDNGVQMPMEVKAGDRVVYSRMAGVPLSVGGDKTNLLVINERDVIAIIE